MATKNRFSRILHHNNSKEINEKIELLNEIPTNNTSGIYIVEPESSIVVDTLVEIEPDLTKDDQEDGRDTTGLFAPDGTILTDIPPGDNSYILGPMILIRYTYPTVSYEIGYIGQENRRFTALGRITGVGFDFSGWDGISNFTSYGQLSLEQAQWFRERFIANQVSEYRTFVNGPPPYFPYIFPGPDEFNRFLGFIVSIGRQIGDKFSQRIPPTVGGFDPNLPPGSANPNKNKQLDDYLKSLPPEIRSDYLKGGKTNDLVNDLLLIGVSAAITKALTLALTSGAATATLDRLKYLAKLRVDRGALNPFGQTAVRSGAAGRQQVDVYSGRPYQGPRNYSNPTQYGTTNQQTANTYTNPGNLKGLPGTGAQTNPRGTLDTGSLPQRYIDKYGSRSVLGQKQIKMSSSAAKRTFGESLEYVEESKKNEYANAFIIKLFSEDPNPYEKINGLIKSIEKYLTTKNNNIKENYQNHKRILKEIKKPYTSPEEPKVKYKFRPKVRSVNSDMMKNVEVPQEFKAQPNVWRKGELKRNEMLSQQRKNDVLEMTGNSDWHWEYMTETSRNRNKNIQYTNFEDKSEKVKGKVIRKEELRGDYLVFIQDQKTNEKKTILQSELNELLAQENAPKEFQKYFQEQETLQADKDPLFKRVSKRLKKEIDYPDKPAKNGYPNDSPPEMINGWHPEYGKDKGYYNKLDPHSAESMPSTGNSEIDDKVQKTRKQPK
jgi:hypothetical protein